MGFGKRRGTGQEFYKINSLVDVGTWLNAKYFRKCVDQLGVLGGATDDNIEGVIAIR